MIFAGRKSVVTPREPVATVRYAPRSFRGSRLCFIGAFLVLAALSCSDDQATEADDAASADYLWVALGPEGNAVARAVTAQNGGCPNIQLDGTTHTMTLRSPASPPMFEEIQVCEYGIPSGTASASIDGQALAVPVSSPQRIVVVGDTGCRVKGNDVQNCTGVDVDSLGPAWNFAAVAASIDAVGPDLIIHVGDYHYRESGTCDARCEQSNIGYTWASWKADFFEPAKTLLPQAPWVFIRGNHEDCGTDPSTARAWKGWFYFLDLVTLPDDPWTWENCQDYTDPYRVPAGPQDILVMDTSEIPDDYAATPDPATVARYAQEFTVIDGLASEGTPAWLTTHRPFWAVASFLDNGVPKIAFTDLTLQAALKQSEDQGIPASVKMLIAGHVHQFEKLAFTDGRPPQLVFGGGRDRAGPGDHRRVARCQPLGASGIGRRQARPDVHPQHRFRGDRAGRRRLDHNHQNADGEDETTFVVGTN